MVVDKNSIKEFKRNSITVNDIDNIKIPKGIEFDISHITKIDNDYYYFKNASVIGSFFSRNNIFNIINELLGTYYSKLLDLDTVEYDIGMSDDFLFSISKLFYKDNVEYQYINKKYKTTSIMCYDPLNMFQYLSLLDQIEDRELLNNYLKLIAVDLKMGQLDRHNYNIILCNENNKTSLAPIYDYSSSFSLSSYSWNTKIYDNPLLVVGKSSFALTMLSKNFPQINEYLDVLYSSSIIDVLNFIQDEKNIRLNKSEIKHYIMTETNNNKILCKVLRK